MAQNRKLKTKKVKNNKMAKMAKNKKINKTKRVIFTKSNSNSISNSNFLSKSRIKPYVSIHKIEPKNASEFENKINNMSGPVLFHHPQCIHCVMMRPIWRQVIKRLINDHINCQILEVNAEALPMITHPLGKVDGFPRLINVENGVEKNVFSDERNVNNMLEFVMKNLKGKGNNLKYNYNLNKKGNLIKLTNSNNIKRVRKKIND